MIKVILAVMKKRERKKPPNPRGDAQYIWPPFAE